MSDRPDDVSSAEHEQQEEHKEEREASEGLGVASLVVGTIGLFVGLLTVVGLRSIALSLGIVAVVLACVSWKRATTGGQRGTAYGGLALGLVTVFIGTIVIRSG